MRSVLVRSGDLCANCASKQWQRSPSQQTSRRLLGSSQSLKDSKRRRENKFDHRKASSPILSLGRLSEGSRKKNTLPSATERAQVSSQVFRRSVLLKLEAMRGLLDTSAYRAQLGIFDVKSHQLIYSWINERIKCVLGWTAQQMEPGSGQWSDWLQRRLWLSYVRYQEAGITLQLKYMAQDYVANVNLENSEISRQARVADLRFPAEWYPRARRLNRKIHLHIGPTNSGKTYQALQSLQAAKTGLYAGPLRLLAHEVHGRMLSKGRSCNLITGDERIISDDPNCGLVSSTVEMVSRSVDFDVAVIDEIQMMAHPERGWAWTEAFLGVSANEVHLCGESRIRPLVEQLTASTCESLTVHEYERLSPLEVGETSLDDDFGNLRPGDCIVAFSRRAIHNIRHQIIAQTGRKVAVVYGSLPPETRAEQARLFNDPESGYDVLVASNAIGMGLNLSIKRIIFATTSKFNGNEMAKLETTEVKQIGGRAGRFRSSYQPNAHSIFEQHSNTVCESTTAGTSGEGLKEARPSNPGIVTTLRDDELSFIRDQMNREPAPIMTAGLKVPDHVTIRYASYFPPRTPLNYIMTRLQDIARVNGRYALSDNRDDLAVADAIASVEELSIEDRLIICAAPANLEVAVVKSCIIAMARCIAECRSVDIFGLPIPIAVLNRPVEASAETLVGLEQLHLCLTLYMWLSFRFVGIFISQPLAQHTRTLTEQRISETLTLLAESGMISEAPKRFQHRLHTLKEARNNASDFRKETKGPSDYVHGRSNKMEVVAS